MSIQPPSRPDQFAPSHTRSKTDTAGTKRNHETKTNSVAGGRLKEAPSSETPKAQKLKQKITVLTVQKKAIADKSDRLNIELTKTFNEIDKTKNSINEVKTKLTKLKNDENWDTGADFLSNHSDTQVYKLMQKELTNELKELESLLKNLDRKVKLIHKEQRIITNEESKTTQTLERKQISLKREEQPDLKPRGLDALKEKIAKVIRILQKPFRSKVNLEAVEAKFSSQKLKIDAKLSSKKVKNESQSHLRKYAREGGNVKKVGEYLCPTKEQSTLEKIKINGKTLLDSNGHAIHAPQSFALEAPRLNYNINNSEYTFAEVYVKPNDKEDFFGYFYEQLESVFGDKLNVIAPLLSSSNQIDLTKLLILQEQAKTGVPVVFRPKDVEPIKIESDMNGKIKITTQIKGNLEDHEGKLTKKARATRVIEFNLADIQPGADIAYNKRILKVTDTFESPMPSKKRG